MPWTSQWNAEWRAAVEDSGLPPDELRIHAVPGRGAPDSRGALYWSPNSPDFPTSTTPPEMVELVEVLGGDIDRLRFWSGKTTPRRS
jgi:hypothetical protein